MAHIAIGRRVRQTTLAERMVEWARSAWRAWRNRRAARELLAMDDRQLADIGLTRGDVDCAFSGPPWHDPSLELGRIATERRRAWRRR